MINSSSLALVPKTAGAFRWYNAFENKYGVCRHPDGGWGVCLPIRDPLVIRSSTFYSVLIVTPRGGFLKHTNTKCGEIKQNEVELNSTTFAGKNNIRMFSWDFFSFSPPARACFSLTFELVSPVSDVFLTALFASSLKQKEQSLG